MKYKVALFIGRFQPFHLGHLYSLKKCLEVAEEVVVAVGSSRESGTKDNPWSYRVRMQMVELVGASLSGDARKVNLRVIELPDYPSDVVWLEEVKRRVKAFDVVVSNNEWVLGIFGQAGYGVYQTGLYNRDELEGVKIRALLRAGDPAWKKRVPAEIVGLISENEI